jgi:NADH:ubiquinone oxidoreductase subunit F (NADH-binding)
MPGFDEVARTTRAVLTGIAGRAERIPPSSGRSTSASHGRAGEVPGGPGGAHAANASHMPSARPPQRITGSPLPGRSNTKPAAFPAPYACGLFPGRSRYAATMRAAHVESFYRPPLPDAAERFCQGTACFAARRRDPARFARALELEPRVYCLGKCWMGVASTADAGRPQMAVKSPRAALLRNLEKGGARTLEAYRRGGGIAAFERARSLGSARILDEIDASELRGRGGAGFPTGRKWRSVGAGGQAVVVANADEGDGGAYIDRFLVEDDPFLLLEGMAIAGLAVDAAEGWIYLRAEYPDARRSLERAVGEAARSRAFGDFRFHVYVGHGSYVCGEETALLNSIEGRRPEIRVRPPYPTQRGLFGRPTLVNNVETLCAVPFILEHGGAAWAALGTGTSKGTKLVSLSALFRRPGLYEVELGIPVRAIVEEIGGGIDGELHSVLIGGPIAGLLPARLLDTRFTFDDLRAVGCNVGHGGIVAFDRSGALRNLLDHVLAFSAYESCGKCTPCRVGGRRLLDQLRGRGRPLTRARYEEICSALANTSLCGHGGGTADFLASLSRHFPEELSACFA